MRPDLQRRIQRFGWDQAAPYYEDSWKDQLKPAQDRMLELAELQPGENVLETACGTGLVTFRAAAAVLPGGEIEATDISELMIETAQQRASQSGFDNIRFNRMDAEELTLDSDRFDKALCGLGLMYVPDPTAAMGELRRTLRPEGKVSVAVWGERKNCGWAEIFPIVDARVASDVCPMFFQQGTGDTLAYTMKESGFHRIQVERIRTVLQYSSPEEALLASFAGGPVALAYRKFDEQTRQNAHREYLDSIAPFRKQNGYEIPGEFVVASAEKSSS